jgi:hypothetical protein
LVYPTEGKPYEVFQTEEQQCRLAARMQLEGSPQDDATKSALKSAAVGTALGPVAGVVLGGAVGNPGMGAGLGAGSGLLLGGVGASTASGMTAQHRYAIAYLQCMYAKGNQVPGMRVAN